MRLAIGGYLVKFGGPVRYLRMPVPRFFILATVFFFFKSITLLQSFYAKDDHSSIFEQDLKILWSVPPHIR